MSHITEKVAALKASDLKVLEQDLGRLSAAKHIQPEPMHVYTDNGRFYRLPNNDLVPGVGTVLRASESEESKQRLAEWLAKPGNPEYAEFARQRGTDFHKRLEDALRGVEGGPYPETTNDLWEAAQGVVKRLSHPVLLESAVYHKQLGYAGTPDSIAAFDYQLMVLDWKTSNKQKRPQPKYPLQLTAYSMALEEMYGFFIPHGATIVFTPKGPQVFRYNLQVCRDAWVRAVDTWKSSYQSTLDQEMTDGCF